MNGLTDSELPGATSERQADFDDIELQQQIERLLFELNRDGLRLVKVQVTRRRARVSGSVPTYYDKQLATSCCQRVAGVEGVQNELLVAASTSKKGDFQ